MKQLRKIEDMIDFENRSVIYTKNTKEFLQFVDGGLKEFLDSNNISILQIDDLENGQVGAILLKRHGTPEEKSFQIMSKIFPPYTVVEEESFETFKDKLEDYSKRDVYVFELHDPKILRLGYVAVLASGWIWHKVRLSAFKQYDQGTESKKESSKIMEMFGEKKSNVSEISENKDKRAIPSLVCSEKEWINLRIRDLTKHLCENKGYTIEQNRAFLNELMRLKKRLENWNEESDK